MDILIDLNLFLKFFQVTQGSLYENFFKRTLIFWPWSKSCNCNYLNKISKISVFFFFTLLGKIKKKQWIHCLRYTVHGPLNMDFFLHFSSLMLRPNMYLFIRKNIYFQIKRIPGQIFQMLNLPIPTYAASTSSYDLTNIVKSVFGVDIFTLMFITMLYILASLALVSIVLPNIYFRLLLWADSSSQDVMASIYDEYDDYDLDYNLLY